MAYLFRGVDHDWYAVRTLFTTWRLDRGINLSLTFEWDPHKAAANVGKHGIEFSEAIAVFDDPLAKIFPDTWHSEDESREIIIGHLRDRRLCLVVFTEIGEDRLRIISARVATPKEQRDYERNAR